MSPPIRARFWRAKKSCCAEIGLPFHEPRQTFATRMDVQKSDGTLETAYRLACETVSDIHEHLPTLRRYASECAHLTEFGVRAVVSTWALLAGRPETLVSYDLVRHENIRQAAEIAQREGIAFQFHEADVRNIRIAPTDLLFIDTLHHADQLAAELELHAGRVERYLIFHDTASFGWISETGEPGKGLLGAIETFLQNHPEWSLFERFENNNGLLILRRTHPRKAGHRRRALPSDNERARLYLQPPRIGLVIGTFAALPHIHLQLEAWKRNSHDVPLLVVDDHSHQRLALQALCHRYGAEFFSSAERRGHTTGDMHVFGQAIEWAEAQGLDLAVKMSRRWVPLLPWAEDLQALAMESQYPTFSSRCVFHNFGFRSECVAMHVPSWRQYGGLDFICAEILEKRQVLVEAVIHAAARKVHEHVRAASDPYEASHPHPPGAGGYGMWPLMGQSRVQSRADVLWHECSHAHEYHRALLQWGIDDYRSVEFLDDTAEIRNR